MPLVGGGGSPNVAGGSPSAIGSTLQFAGNNYWSGHSGWVDVADGSDATWFSFTSPLRVATRAKLYWSFDYASLTGGKYYGMELEINGQVLLQPRARAIGTGDIRGNPLENMVEFIMFPGDNIVIKGQTDNGSSVKCGAAIVVQGLFE